MAWCRPFVHVRAGKIPAQHQTCGVDLPRMTRPHSEDETLSAPAPAADEAQSRLWAMLLHLSMLGGCFIPLAGFLAPIVIWRIKRDELPQIDAHGRAAANWILSSALYGALLLVLFYVSLFFSIGGLLWLPIMSVAWLLCAVWMILPVIAGIRAHQGHAWRYPLAIPFFRQRSTAQDL